MLLTILFFSIQACKDQNLDIKSSNDYLNKELSLKNHYNTIIVTKDIPYREGSSDSWKLDLAMPENFGNELRPALVIINDGGWVFGSKSVDVYQKMMVACAKKGCSILFLV